MIMTRLQTRMPMLAAGVEIRLRVRRESLART